MEIVRDIESTAQERLPVASASVALGLFDGLHPGHAAVIGAAVQAGKQRGLTPCVFTFTRQGGTPTDKEQGALLSDEQFYATLADWGVARVVRPDFAAFRDLTPEEFVRQVLLNTMGAGAVFCGSNFRFGKNAAGDAALLAELCTPHATVQVVPMVEQDGAAISTTRIKMLLKEGKMEEANRLWGRCFAIDFTVTKGRALGRTIGFPTINQPFPQGFCQPRYGVYATAVTVAGTRYAGVTNVGVKPTVGSDAVLAETFISGFSGNLYGQNVLVEFLHFLRPEQKFDSVDALQQQILRDSAEAIAWVHNAEGNIK